MRLELTPEQIELLKNVSEQALADNTGSPMTASEVQMLRQFITLAEQMLVYNDSHPGSMVLFS